MEYDERDKPASIEVWYDRHTKSWVVQRFTENHSQIGDADYVYTKREAKLLETQYRKEVS